jgi:predicted NBD/HSP70 family sugar kinase
VVAAAQNGDGPAREALDEATRALSVALAHAYNLLDHELTVLAGGAVSEFWPNVERLEAEIRTHIHPSIHHVRLERSVDPGTGVLRGMAIQTLLWWKETG